MKVYSYRAIIEPDEKGYHGYIPVVRGCHSTGATIEETKINLKEALLGCLKTLVAHREPLPVDDSYEYIELIPEMALPALVTKQTTTYAQTAYA